MIAALAVDPPPMYTLSCSKLEYSAVEKPDTLDVKLLLSTTKDPKATPAPTISMCASILDQAFSCRAKSVLIVVLALPWRSLNLQEMDQSINPSVSQSVNESISHSISP